MSADRCARSVIIERAQRYKTSQNDVNRDVQVIVMEIKKLLLVLLIGAAVMVNGESFCR